MLFVCCETDKTRILHFIDNQLQFEKFSRKTENSWYSIEIFCSNLYTNRESIPCKMLYLYIYLNGWIPIKWNVYWNGEIHQSFNWNFNLNFNANRFLINSLELWIGNDLKVLNFEDPNTPKHIKLLIKSENKFVSNYFCFCLQNVRCLRSMLRRWCEFERNATFFRIWSRFLRWSFSIQF